MATQLGCQTPLNLSPSINTLPTYTNDSGTFIYCNNPEWVKTEDLGDSNLGTGIGNHYLLWSKVTGTCYAYYEHANHVGSPIYYGIKIYNPNSTAVTVNITNTAFTASNDPNNSDLIRLSLWDTYMGGSGNANNLIGPQTIQAGQSLWIQKDNSVPTDAIWEGAVKFTVSGGYVYVYNFAYMSPTAFGPAPTYTGWVTRTDSDQYGSIDESRVYKGTASAISLSSSMSVDVPSLLSRPMVWQTNGCKAKFPDAVERDVLAISIPTGDSGNPTYTSTSCTTSLPGNLANWGVPYTYTLTLTNNSSTAYNVNLSFKAGVQPGFTAKSYIWVRPSGATVAYKCMVDSNSFCKAFTQTVAPYSTSTLTYTIFLGGDSAGGLLTSLSV